MTYKLSRSSFNIASTLCLAILAKFKPCSRERAVQGGAPMIQAGFLVWTSHKASRRSEGFVKSHGAPLGFRLRKSNASIPWMVKLLYVEFPPLCIDLLPYNSTTDGCGFLTHEQAKRDARIGSTPMI